MISKLFGTALFLSLCLMIAPVQVEAAEKPTSIKFSGITITPALNKVNLDPAQQTVEYPITVINNTNKPVNLKTKTVDFKSLNESGGIAFITSSSQQLINKYGLTKWLSVQPESFSIEPNKVQILKVTVANSPEMTPGGHYAAILFQSQNGSTNRGETHVDINQVVSSLVFVKKLGGEKFDLQLKPVQLGTYWFNLPETVGLTFKNTGNVQTAPRGLVKVTDLTGREVARGQVNTDSSMVLPESSRYYRTELNKTSRSIMPGVYRLKVSYSADGSVNKKNYQEQFVFVNLPFLIGAILIITGLVLLTHKIFKSNTKNRTK